MSRKYIIASAAAAVLLLNAGFVYADQGPEIDSITPTSVTSSHDEFTLVVLGKHFRTEAVIYFSGPPALVPERISEHELHYTFLANSLSAGMYYISVTDQGGTSNEVEFTVYNSPPTADDLSVASDSCAVAEDTGLAFFSWNYQDIDGDNEEWFQFQIDNDADFSSPAVDRTYDGLSNPAGTQNQQAVNIIVNGDENDSLKYNTTYRWRVKVCQVNVDPELMAETPLCSAWTNGQNYTTIAYPGPYISFSASDTSPGITFTNTSVCYNASGPVACASYLYDFGDGSTFTVNNPAQGTTTTTHTYSQLGSYDVAVTATAPGNLQCQGASAITVSNQTTGGLPFWRETNPYHFGNQCLENGQAVCNDNSVCCSGYCYTPLGMCAPQGCAGAGDACASNSDCCSNQCSVGSALKQYGTAGLVFVKGTCL
ncbi:MAG TPA: PKD domain-containing protein [Negativicutes bacterium]|nr:PKD domain-containing protein [Negativicutes bacterium]